MRSSPALSLLFSAGGSQGAPLPLEFWDSGERWVGLNRAGGRPTGDCPLLALHRASWGPYCGVPCSRGFRGSNQASPQPIFQMGTLRGPEACLGRCREEKSILAPGWGNREGRCQDCSAGRARPAPVCGNCHPGPGEETDTALGAHSQLVEEEEGCCKGPDVEIGL